MGPYDSLSRRGFKWNIEAFLSSPVHGRETARNSPGGAAAPAREGEVRATIGTTLVLLVSLEAAAQAPAPPPSPSPSAERTLRTVPLRDLVVEALHQNLTLTTARASTKSTQTAVQSAESAFDPLLLVTPVRYTHSPQSLLAQPDVTLDGTQTGTTVVGFLDGTLPISTVYGVSVNMDRVSQDNPALLQPGVLTPTVNNSLTFSVAQPLLKGFGPTYAQAGVHIAEYTSSAAEARLDRTVDQTAADVETAYWSLGLAEELERIARASLGRADELLTRNEKMLQLKLISEVDLISSRRGQQERLTTLTEAVRQRRDAADRLLFLVYGRTAPAQVVDAESLHTEPPPSDVPPVPGAVADLEGQALKQRRDYQAATIDVTQSELTKKVNKNALLPDLRLTGAYIANVFNTDAARFFGTSRVGDLEQKDWRVGVNVSYPIGNRFARAAYAKARLDAEALAETQAQSEMFVRSDVRNAARAIDANRERLAQASLSSDYARQQYEAGQKQLQLGLIDSFRLLQMEQDVSVTDLVRAQTRYDLAQALTNFNLAMGTIGAHYR
jgi:outer membrane protein TolC